MSQQTYFKNPYRGRKAANTKPYQPEHKRLEAQTVEYPLKDPEEFEKMNRKVAAEKKRSEKKKKVDEQAKAAVEKFRNGELSKESLEETLRELYNKVPEQEVAAKQLPLVSSGQNEDLQWTKALNNDGNIVDEQLDNEDISVDEVPDPPESPFVEDEEEDSLQPTWKESEETTEDIINELKETAADIIENVREASENEDLDVEEGDNFDFKQIKSGEYLLLYKNSVIGMGSLESVKNTLSSVMDGDDTLSVESFVVMKRVPVKMGIFIDD